MAKCELCRQKKAVAKLIDMWLCEECWNKKHEENKKKMPQHPDWETRDAEQRRRDEELRLIRQQDEYARVQSEEAQRRQEEERRRIQQEEAARRRAAAAEAAARELAAAKMLNDLYEYDIEIIANKSDGTVDSYSIRTAIAEHAKLGWRLHTMYSNEVGKNSSSYMGSGTNATICQDVLVFERRIEDRQA